MECGLPGAAVWEKWAFNQAGLADAGTKIIRTADDVKYGEVVGDGSGRGSGRGRPLYFYICLWKLAGMKEKVKEYKIQKSTKAHAGMEHIL
ncbi:MAG: hypothetical protein C4519_10660 [Desulfobacteraceae bacterium]|nr:MAG: hypothetical protein C4519_10660 [Desulfobacteraceae bacterium]